MRREALAGLCGLSLSGVALAQPLPVIRVSSDDRAPGTSYDFAALGPPHINSAGQIVFWGVTTQVSGFGIWRWDPVLLDSELVALSGGSAAGHVFHTFNNDPSINDGGVIAFAATLRPSHEGRSGVFKGTPGSLSPIAVSGATAPGTNETFLSFFQSGLSTPVHINNSGDVAFFAWLNNSAGGSWYYHEGSPATIGLVVVDDMILPSTLPPPFGGARISGPRIEINHDGQVAYVAAAADGNAMRYAYFCGDVGASQSQLFRFGYGDSLSMPCPLGVCQRSADTVIGGPFLSGAGQAAMSWTFGYPMLPAENAVLQTELPQPPTAPPPVADSFVQMAGGRNAAPFYTPSITVPSGTYPAMDHQGRSVFAFQRTPEPPISLYQDTVVAYWIGGPEYKVIAHEGSAPRCITVDLAPPVDPPVEEWTWSDFLNPEKKNAPSFVMAQVMNEVGQAVMLGNVRRDTPSGPEGRDLMYGMDLRFNRRYRVLAQGDLLGGRVVNDMVLGHPTGVDVRDNQNAGRAVINDCGVVAFLVTFENGTYSICTWKMPAPADINGDGLVNVTDYVVFGNLASAEHCKADFDDDGEISANDYILFMNAYAIGQACP